MKKKIDISIIIVNYKKFTDTIDCINSLNKQITKLNFNIIIVENNSQNNSEEKLKVYCDENKIFMLKATENRGYCAGNNIGIKFALDNFEVKYIWILNPDTIVDENTMQRLFDYAETKDDLGILGCKLIYYPDTEYVQALGGGNFGIQKNGLLGPGKHIYHLRASNEILPKDVTLDLIIGASMFIPKKIFEVCGLMDESFFLYSDENEFCLRVSQFGFKHYAISDAIVFHKEGWRQADQKLMTVYYAKRNSLLMTKKLFPKYLFRNVFFSYLSKSVLLFLLKRNWKALKLYFKAIYDFKKGIIGRVDLSKYL